MLGASQIDPSDVLAGWQATRASRHEYLFVFGAVLLVCTFVFLWAVFLRKRRRQRRYHYPRAASTNSAGNGQIVQQQATEPRKHSRRRRRRDRHRPRKPTLAETGGLPPIRSDWPGSSS